MDENIDSASSYSFGSQEVLGDHILPPVNFSHFILTIWSSGLVHLGDVQDPATGEVSQNLQMVKHAVDILSMLEKKTQNNLDKEEKELLSALLCELRLKYLQKSGY